MLDRRIENRVLEFIANAKEPIHSTDIANALDINRVTITKYLSVLHSKGLISYKNIGMAKIWMPVESPVLQAFEVNDVNNTTIEMLNSLTDGVCVLEKDMRILWVNNEMEKRHGKLDKIKGKKCFEVFREEKDICKNCAVKKTFETGKRSVARTKNKGNTIEITTSPLKDRNGKVIAVVEIVQVTKKV